MSIALFDLDNTLLAGDSDYLWGQFLIEKNVIDGKIYEEKNQMFFEQYKEGSLDIHEFLNFQLAPLAKHSMKQLKQWHDEYMHSKIKPIMLPQAQKLIEHHRSAGYRPVIITATNRFITEPIAKAFNIDDLLATEPEKNNNGYTGNVTGTPCFQSGKVTHLETWLDEHDLDLDDSWFYSDSHNDIPLLEKVTYPVAVNPDTKLEAHAQELGWPILHLNPAVNPIN